MDLLSSQPYWRLRHGIVKSYPSLHADQKCQALIVGGGISGALIAYELVKAGVDTLIIDKFDIGSGSTSGSTALIQYEIDVSLVELTEILGDRLAAQAYLAAHSAIDKLSEIAHAVDHHPFQKKKSFYLASETKDAAMLQVENAARAALGLDSEFITGGDVEKLFDFKRSGAILTHQAAQLDPYLLAHQLLRYSQSRGLRIYDRVCMESFDCDGTTVEVKTSDGPTIRADHLIFANGYDSAKLIPKKLVDLHSTFAIVSKPMDDFGTWYEQSLLWETARPYTYLRVTDDKRALIGGLDEPFYNPEKRDAFVHAKSHKLKDLFNDYFPKINFDLAYGWAGTFAETKDGLPYIGPLANQKNCHFACCFGGNGITFSTIAAEMIRDAVLGKENLLSDVFGFQRSGL